MENYLNLTKKLLSDLTQFNQIHVVIGNEACDLDSAVSSLVYAYFLCKENEALEDHLKFVCPVLNIVTADYKLKTEVKYYLSKFGIHQDQLIFRDDINLNQIHAENKLTLTLVDHNKLLEHDKNLEDSVREIIDHHVLQPSGPERCPDICIDMVGSCCTLIANRIFEKQRNCIMDPTIIELLYGTIILDTGCLNEEAGRTTLKDLEAIERFDSHLPALLGKRRKMYNELVKAKADISELSDGDLLRKDLKVVESADNSIQIAISSFPRLVQEVISERKATILSSLQRFSLDNRYDVIVLLGIDLIKDIKPINPDLKSNSSLTRDLAIYGYDYNNSPSHLIESFSQYLIEFNFYELGLVPVTDFDEYFDSHQMGTLNLYHQENVRATRKVVLPAVQKFLKDIALSEDVSNASSPYSPNRIEILTEPMEDINEAKYFICSINAPGVSKSTPYFPYESRDINEDDTYNPISLNLGQGNLTFTQPRNGADMADLQSQLPDVCKELNLSDMEKKPDSENSFNDSSSFENLVKQLGDRALTSALVGIIDTGGSLKNLSPMNSNPFNNSLMNQRIHLSTSENAVDPLKSLPSPITNDESNKIGSIQQTNPFLSHGTYDESPDTTRSYQFEIPVIQNECEADLVDESILSGYDPSATLINCEHSEMTKFSYSEPYIFEDLEDQINGTIYDRANKCMNGEMSPPNPFGNVEHDKLIYRNVTSFHQPTTPFSKIPIRNWSCNLDTLSRSKLFNVNPDIKKSMSENTLRNHTDRSDRVIELHLDINLTQKRETKHTDEGYIDNKNSIRDYNNKSPLKPQTGEQYEFGDGIRVESDAGKDIQPLDAENESFHPDQNRMSVESPQNDLKNDLVVLDEVLSKRINYKIDHQIIEPYKRIFAFGGYTPEDNVPILCLYACYLPSRSIQNYEYVMENLFFYVVKTLHTLVDSDFILLFFEGSAPRECLPPFKWLLNYYRIFENGNQTLTFDESVPVAAETRKSLFDIHLYKKYLMRPILKFAKSGEVTNGDTSNPFSQSVQSKNRPNKSVIHRPKAVSVNTIENIRKLLRKNIRYLYIIHPSFWIRSVCVMCQPFMANSFRPKLNFVKNLQVLKERVNTFNQNHLPTHITEYDKKLHEWS